MAEPVIVACHRVAMAILADIPGTSRDGTLESKYSLHACAVSDRLKERAQAQKVCCSVRVSGKRYCSWILADSVSLTE
jgi:hypothetical protein